MPTGREIMQRAATMLNDDTHVRWPLPELCDWINEAVRAVILAKPSASTQSRVLTLVKGTLQAVPQGGAEPKALMLVRIVRNLKDATSSPRAGGRVVSATDRAILDAQQPRWHESAYVPFRKEVRQYIYDENVPLEFYTYPGNDGTGVVEAEISTLPTPLAADDDPAVIDSYGADIGLPEPYSGPVLDYTLFKCFSKDDLTGVPARAQAHYQLFAAAVGLKIQVERATSPNAQR